jgi:hypothetical protein
MAEQKTWSFCKECRKKYTEAELKYMQDNSDLSLTLPNPDNNYYSFHVSDLRKYKKALEGEKR